MRAMPDAGKTPGRRFLEAMLNGQAAPPPFAILLHMRLTEVGEGTVSFEMPVTEDLYNPNDVVHGGAIASLVDSAMGLAVVTTLEEGENFTTAELKVNYLRAVTSESGPLTCTGRVVHRGRQIAVAEGDVLDANNQLVARASSTNVVLMPRTASAVTGSGRAGSISVAGTPPPAPVVPLAGAPLSPADAPVPMEAGPMPSPGQAMRAPAATPAFAAPHSPLEHRRAMTTPAGPAPSAIQPAPLARTKGRVRLFSGDIAYLRRGQGPPVLLLHGIPSSSFIWRDVIDPLSERFDVIAPDLVGYGDSDKRLDADLSVAAQARYLIAFMEALRIYQVAIVGHDIGGGIAQLIAADEPARVARLVLIDSIVDNNWPVPDIARLKDPAWDQIMVGLDLHKGFRKALEGGIVTPGRVSDELVDEYVRPFADQNGRRAYLRAARALNNRDLTTRAHHIREIATPTLVLWGQDDKFLPTHWGEQLQRKLSNARLQLIAPGGHFLPLDRPDAVSAEIQQFLGS
jgi:uncharacterized protein (TIGR00369 family)